MTCVNHETGVVIIYLSFCSNSGFKDLPVKMMVAIHISHDFVIMEPLLFVAVACRIVLMPLWQDFFFFQEKGIEVWFLPFFIKLFTVFCLLEEIAFICLHDII